MSDRDILNLRPSSKETRHIVIELGDSGIQYKVGDALGIIPQNPPHLVDGLIECMGASPDDKIKTSKGDRKLSDAFREDVEIHRLSKKVVQALASKSSGSTGAPTIRTISNQRHNLSSREEMIAECPKPSRQNGNPFDRIAQVVSSPSSLDSYIGQRDYIDLVNEIGTDVLSGQEIYDLMDRMKPRLYSIASSLDVHPGQVQLTVAIVRYETLGRRRAGLCTGWLADVAELDATDIPVFLSPTRSFVLPPNPNTDVIMIGPGTGIAPFRAFLEQRAFDGGNGRNWLFFGDWTESGDFLYRDELEKHQSTGVLTSLTTAFSRDQDTKVYVQHRMQEHASEIWNWIENGAHFYVCGDKSKMAKDVHQTLIKIAIEYGQRTEEDATHYVEKILMREEKRYLRDVY